MKRILLMILCFMSLPVVSAREFRDANELALRVQTQDEQWRGSATTLGFWGPVLSAAHVVKGRVQLCSDAPEPSPEPLFLATGGADTPIAIDCYDQVPIDVAGLPGKGGERLPYELVRLHVDLDALESLNLRGPEAFAYNVDELGGALATAFGWQLEKSLAKHRPKKSQGITASSACVPLEDDPIVFCFSTSNLAEGMSGGPIVVPKLALAGLSVHRQGANVPVDPLSIAYEEIASPHYDPYLKKQIGTSAVVFISLQLIPRALSSLIDTKGGSLANQKYYNQFRSQLIALSKAGCNVEQSAIKKTDPLAPLGVYLLASRERMLADAEAATAFFGCYDLWSGAIDRDQFSVDTMGLVLADLCSSSVVSSDSGQVCVRAKERVSRIAALSDADSHLSFARADTLANLAARDIERVVQSADFSNVVSGRTELAKNFLKDAQALTSLDARLGNPVVASAFIQNLPDEMQMVGNPYTAIASTWNDVESQRQIANVAVRLAFDREDYRITDATMRLVSDPVRDLSLMTAVGTTNDGQCLAGPAVRRPGLPCAIRSSELFYCAGEACAANMDKAAIHGNTIHALEEVKAWNKNELLDGG